MTSIEIIREMAREDLQLGWSHLEDGNEDMALHHFCSAVDKVKEIKAIKGTPATPERGLSNRIQHEPHITIDVTNEPDKRKD